MLSTGSLSAFSASVTQAGFGQVQQARASSVQAVQSAPQPSSSGSPNGSPGMLLGAPSSGRILPRGSLIDLSV